MRRSLFRPFLSVLLGAFCAALPTMRAVEPVPGAPESAIKDLGNGVYEIGNLRLDQQQRTAVFPGAVNMDKGALEYLLVTKEGPTHESLLISDITPSDLHLAMVLLGAKGAGIQAPAPADAPPAQITAEYLKYARPLTGDRITISVEWQDRKGEKKKAPVEDWIYMSNTKKPAPRGPWIYNGSMFGTNGHFLAQSEGAFAALVTNPSALINNPRKGNNDDQIWEVNQKVVPPAETPVQIVVHLEAPAAPAP
jgi:hypothetical protein